ncbi:MAG TPA: helix-turn-helix transcriptional regulator [Pseudonocardia sp.]|uniref:helix-turn-helix domain-containing protein n=1 Tax=Pseudonocardia sp. TaxID=60912 RepID=UPI002C742A0C|nr:helix-turn-helix transcriptional regulator [Pseudonocardia sp.]HTF49373.1 helix-turn-helix transcriptional regulator [Pseudonocardia sp.]
MANTSAPDTGPPGSQLHATANVRAEAARRGVSIRELCRRIGMARSTWARRSVRPGTWRLAELQAAARVLDVPMDRLADGVDR